MEAIKPCREERERSQDVGEFPGKHPWQAAALVALALGSASVAGVSCTNPPEAHVAVTGEACVACHLSEALRATEPPHTGKMAMACGDCHGEEAWQPAPGFDHGEHFALRGAHAQVVCTRCHAVGFEAGQTPSECVGCHRDDYDASPFPGHAAFATTCQDCHGDVSWKPATTPDHDQFFPLDGKHTEVACASCHTRGYEPGVTPKTCVGCHQDDYDGSPYPGHADFPTTCADCHATSGWTPASGGIHPEAAFPIATGAHKEVACLECHDTSLGPMGAGNTICAQCHEHTQAQADAQHLEADDYVWDPARPSFCLECHRDGTKND